VTALVFLIVFLDLVGFGLVIPLLPFYVKSMGGSAEFVGAMLASFSLTQLVATPTLGRLSDRVGRRPVILLSLGGNALAMGVFAFATHAHWLPLLFASRLVAGATAGNLSACQAAVADVTSGEKRAAGMGRVGAGIGLGLVLGPVIGGLVSKISPAAPSIAAAGMALVGLLVCLAFFPETRLRPTASAATTTPAVPLGALLERWSVTSVLLMFFLSFMALTSLQVAFALLTEARLGWGPEQVGYGFALTGFIMLVVQGGLIGPLVRRFGELPLFVAGSVLISLGMATISQAHSVVTLLAGSIVMSLGFGVTQPVMSTIASIRAGDEHRGAVLGFAQSAGGVARTIGPLWAGFLFSHFGPGAPFLSSSVAGACCVLLGLVMLRRAG
jgi:MFS family permease